MNAEELEPRLNAVVEAGTLTQAQADEISAWVADAPEALGDLVQEAGGFGDRRHHGPRGWGFPGIGRHGPWNYEMPNPNSSDSESGAVEPTSGQAA